MENIVEQNKNNKVSNFTQRLEDLQNVMIANNDLENIYGDGENLVDNEVFQISHDYCGPLYMRKMIMPKDSVVVSAVHHTNHFWFLLKGKISVTTDEETVEHIAPCYSRSLKGAKRFIICVEECLFINVHANPTESKDIEEIQDDLYSITLDEYIKKEKLWQE
jgi:hypothetical protein